MNNNILLFLQILGMGNNPQQIMQNIINQNPQVQQVINQINQMKQSGKSYQQLVMEYAQKNNIDIQPMVNLLRRGNKI